MDHWYSVLIYIHLAIEKSFMHSVCSHNWFGLSNCWQCHFNGLKVFECWMGFHELSSNILDIWWKQRIYLIEMFQLNHSPILMNSIPKMAQHAFRMKKFSYVSSLSWKSFESTNGIVTQFDLSGIKLVSDHLNEFHHEKQINY